MIELIVRKCPSVPFIAFCKEEPIDNFMNSIDEVLKN